MDLNGEKVIGTFYEKELKKTNQEEFRIEKGLKRKKVISCMLNGKSMIILLIVGLIKKTLYKNESIFSYTIKSLKLRLTFLIMQQEKISMILLM